MRCFPPVALAWDPTSGLYIFPNLFSQTIIIDSSPALWSYSQGSEKTIVVLLVQSFLWTQLFLYHHIFYFHIICSQNLHLTLLTILYTLQVDPHCSYKTSVSVSVTAAASRFLLLYGSQVTNKSAYMHEFDAEREHSLVLVMFFCLLSLP